MAKKSFRPQQSGSPGYPILRDVDHATFRRWGLVGLLLGGAACTPAKAEIPPPGAPPLQRVETKPAAKPDASLGADEPETTVVRMMGKSTAARIDEPKQDPPKAKKAEKKTKKAKSPDKKGDAKAKADAGKEANSKDPQPGAVQPPPQPPGLVRMGKMRAPRVDDKEKLSL